MNGIYLLKETQPMDTGFHCALDTVQIVTLKHIGMYVDTF